MMFPRRLCKAVTVFMLLVFVNSVVAPTVSYALTAGPTAPEATSFEPVDTTDLVDLKTGDFTYNVPLLEVPGPAGGYPLSLGYHAGIQPEQEASWTGLGFVLNPGSISRLVNGYPDDHRAVSDVTRSFWEGGETEVYTVGLSVGVANAVSVSAGLTFANDTYKGNGVGMYAGIGAGYKLGGVGLQTNSMIGISPYGGAYTSSGLNIGLSVGNQQAAALSVGASFEANSQTGLSAGMSGGVDVGGRSILGASISTSNSRPSLSLGGGTANVYNSRAGHVSTNTGGFQIDVPIYNGINLRLGRDYQRSWIDESEEAVTYGSLYTGIVDPSKTTAYDNYDLLDTDIDVARFGNAEEVLGGSFPDFDSYTVMGQGIGGSIRPYHYRQHLYRQTKEKDNKVLIRNHKLNTLSNDKPVEFRFVGDFSNRFDYTPGSIGLESGDISYDFKDNFVTGKTGSDGYNNDSNHLAGSRHVEWYTNQEILLSKDGINPFDEGFINCTAEGFRRSNDLQIGGFSITNASGVTYHYALPAYSYEEYMKSVNSKTKQDQSGLAYNELKKPTKYAYTWYLTAVTGPDFVDRNSNGLADEGDWGYWVTFEYKKWLEDFKWRNPGEGTNPDLDGDFENFSTGKKQVYYLSRIKTESHVAVFETSERWDGREVVDGIRGGFEPIPYTIPGRQYCMAECEGRFCNQGDCEEPALSECNESCADLPDDKTMYIVPRPSLRLDNIKLFSSESFKKNDLSDQNILKAVSFGYDYSLASGTPNSYSNDDLLDKRGKLTLKSLTFSGKHGVSLIPPMSFAYKNVPYKKGMIDAWGFYKSDFSETFLNETNETIARQTSAESAQDVDAWSLTSVTTSLGATINIDYESDKYDDVVLAKRQGLRVKTVADYELNKLKLTFWEELDLPKYFQPGDSVSLNLMGTYLTARSNTFSCTCGRFEITEVNFSKTFSGYVQVESVNRTDGSLIVSSEAFYKAIKLDAKKIDQLYENNQNGHNGNCEDSGPRINCTFTFSGAKAWPQYIPAGFVSVDDKGGYGGGLRVKSISVMNSSSEGRVTNYEYEHGVTSYEPYDILSAKIDPTYAQIYSPRETAVNYKRAMLVDMYNQISVARELPGPGVVYKTVRVKEDNITADGISHRLPNYSEYEFQTYEVGMVDVVRDPVRTRLDEPHVYDGITCERVITKDVAVKDYSSRVGDLKMVSLYNAIDNSVVSQTRNTYLYDELDGSLSDNINKYETLLKSKFGDQGVVDESYAMAKIVCFEMFTKRAYPQPRERSEWFYDDTWQLLGGISKKETFPSIATGQENTNFKTGVKTVTRNLAFDFYSGELTKVLTQDSYGNSYLAVTEPAYDKYPDMGLKIYDKHNKNMLTQTAGSYSFLSDANANPIGVLSASAQTWSNEILTPNNENLATVWKPQSTYIWEGIPSSDLNAVGPYADFDVHQFKWASPDQESNPFWQMTTKQTLSDIYSHVLEATDINGNYSATRMTPDRQMVMASVVNSTYDEMAYSGTEYMAGNTQLEGGVDRGSGTPSTAHVHTGAYSLLVAYGNDGFNYTLASGKMVDLSKKYRASVWVYAPGESETQPELNKLDLYYTLDGKEAGVVHPVLQKTKSKSWYLLSIDIDPNCAQSVHIGVRNHTSRGVYFDDFRVCPLDASMSSYVYDSFSGELMFILDANNFYTKFEYDAMGRLVRSSKELLNFDFGNGKESFRADAVLKEVKYNYGKK